MKGTRRVLSLLLLCAAVPALSTPGRAGAQEPEKSWKDKAELTFVMTGGNSTASTLGFKNTLDRSWSTGSLQLSAGGIRTRTGTVTRTATGTPDNYRITETKDERTTAESYFLRGRLDRKLSERSFLSAGAGWDRNTFAGVENRYVFSAGGGRSWFDEDTRKLKTDLGLTYTIQDDVVEDPNVDNHFAGLRGSYDYFRSLTETTDFSSVLVADQSLKETSDFRADWTNSVAVAMSERLALKTSFQVLYDKSPALVAVPLDDIEVLTPLKKVDTLFTVAIVANF